MIRGEEGQVGHLIEDPFGYIITQTGNQQAQKPSKKEYRENLP